MMKKSIFLAAATALFILGGCGKEPEPTPQPQPQPEPQPEPTVENTVLTAVISPITRTLLSDDLKVSWSAGDKIMANGTTSDAVKAAASSATFSFSKKLDYPISALYPSTAWKSSTSVTVPANQQGVDGSFAAGADLLYSYITEGTSASFHHLMAVLKIPVKGEPKINRITVTAVGGEQLSGDFTIDYKTGALTPKASPSDAEKAVTVRLDKVAPTAFIALPAGEYKQGLVLQIFDADGNSVEELKPAMTSLAAGTIYSLPEIEFVLEHKMKGSGTESDPYQITLPEDMPEITGKLVDEATTYFKLMNDIDMSSLEGEWTPLMLGTSETSPKIYFDGNNKTITGFNGSSSTSKYASLFGILNGTVKDLTIRDSKVECSVSTPIGILAGWVGNSNGTCKGTVENVHIINSSVTSTYISSDTSKADPNVGGLVGSTHASSFKDCSFDGTVTRTDETNAAYSFIGGLIGRLPTNAQKEVTIVNCSTTGKVIAHSGRAVGGLIGGVHASANIDLVGCRSEMDIEATKDVVGGLVGYWGDGTLTDCSYKGTITTTITGNAFVGGLVAHTNLGSEFYRCHSEGAIVTTGGLVGGIIGNNNAQSAALTKISLEECWSTMTISGGSNVGGLVGRTFNKFPLTIKDCWYSGDITTISNSGYVGGICGDAPKDTEISNCWAGGTIKAFYSTGGILGRAFNRQGSSAARDTDLNIIVSNCIAWQSSMTSASDEPMSPASKYSCGAVVGFTSTKNTMTECVRRSDMAFSMYADPALNVLYDMEASDPANPIVEPFTDPEGAETPQYTYFIPYHGKAAAAGETVSAVAKRLGWDEAIWDLSGATPTLKNNK